MPVYFRLFMLFNTREPENEIALRSTRNKNANTFHNGKMFAFDNYLLRN